jgi:hypothetical protein
MFSFLDSFLRSETGVCCPPGLPQKSPEETQISSVENLSFSDFADPYSRAPSEKLREALRDLSNLVTNDDPDSDSIEFSRYGSFLEILVHVAMKTWCDEMSARNCRDLCDGWILSPWRSSAEI